MKKVMNNLNSILLEGTVSGGPCVVKERGMRCSFVVSSLHCFKDGKHMKKQETRVWVMIRNPNLVDVALVKAGDGRGVRVVGRIAMDEDGGIYIEADHVEYRPEPKDTEGEK
jgi:hypothetical protein